MPLTAVFPKYEEYRAYRAKRNALIFYFITLAVFLGIEIFMIVFDIVQVNDYHNRAYTKLFTYLSVAISVLFGWYSVIFLSVKFRLIKNYAKIFTDMRTGILSTDEGKFNSYDFTIKDKDGIEFYTMNVDCTPKDRRYESTSRQLLVYKEAPPLDVQSGQKMKIITQGNMLVAYEICGDVNEEN